MQVGKQEERAMRIRAIPRLIAWSPWLQLNGVSDL
jgi:hypothetical protein